MLTCNDDIKLFKQNGNVLNEKSSGSRFDSSFALLTACGFYKNYPPRRPLRFRQEMASEDHGRHIASLLKDISTLETQTENVYAHEAVCVKLLQATKRDWSALSKSPGMLYFTMLSW